MAWRNNSNDQYLLTIADIVVKEVLDNDAGIESLSINSTQTNGSTVAVSGIIENTGLNALTSVILNYSTDGGVTILKDTLAMNIASFSSAPFSHSTSITATNPGLFTNLSVWTTFPNSVPDSLNANDTINAQFFVNNGLSASKNVLLEEFTTAPCQFCPDGAVVVEQILAANPAVIAVAEHACFGTDAMTIPEASTYCSAFSGGAPTATIDRTLFNGETGVGHSRNRWAANANTQSNLNTPVSVTLTGSYNAVTRSATVDVDANFVDFGLPGDLRVTLFVVEDSVTGTGSGYDQVNAYNTTTGHPYAGAGNPIIGFVHRHVLRDVYPAGNAWGQPGVVPMNPQPNGTYSQNFTFNMNAAWKTKDISLVAFVSYFDTDVTKREILNVEEVKLNNLVTSIEEVLKDENSLTIYPNPTSEITNISFDLIKPQNVTMEIRDVAGKLMIVEDYGKLSQGKQNLNLNVNSLSNGIYFVTMNIDNKKVSKKLSVNR